MQIEQAKTIVQGISRALQALRLYPVQHPASRRQIQECLNAFSEFFLERGKVKMGLVDNTLMLEEHLFAYPSPAEEEVCELLQAQQWEGLEFENGLAVEELAHFFQLIKDGAGQGGSLTETLGQRGIDHIRLVRLEVSEEEARQSPKEIYNRALEVVDNIFHDVRLGRVPTSGGAMDVVKGMAKLTVTDPHALFALSMIKDYDNYTFTHSVNVAVIALMIGRAHDLAEEDLRVLGLGGLLHDIGKLKIDLDIINKPGRLTRDEFEKMKRHPITGAEIVQQMEGVTEEVIDIVHYHHLHYDREGYPADGRGRRLSTLVDMATIADTYDAMTTLRSYQRPMSPRQAIERLRELKGTLLHPDFTDRFVASLGTYPVGSLVRLDSNEIGLVVRVGSQDPDDVDLKILFDPSGRRLHEPGFLHLVKEETRRIVAEVDPFTKAVNVTDHFS